MNLIDIFEQVVEKHNNKIAIRCEDIELTYEQLNRKIDLFASNLLSNGVAYEDGIIVLMDNSIDSVVMLMVALKIGIYVVPISLSLPMDSINNAIEYSDAKHIMAPDNFYNLTDIKELNIRGSYFSYDDIAETIYIKQKNDKKVIIPEVNGNEKFILSLTSGSTGNPKPINLIQKNKLNRINKHVEMYGLNSDDIILTSTPLYHTLAQRLVLMPLMIGATAVIMSRYTVDRWVDSVINNNVSFTISASAQLNQLKNYLEKNDIELNSLRCIVSSSSLLSFETKKYLTDKLNCDFNEIYGTSETSTVTNINFKSTIKDHSVGQSIDGADILIVDTNNKPVSDNCVGEIICRTDLLCKSYYNNDKEFQKNIIDGYFKTGDLGYQDNEGYIYFKSRKKEIIITGGINVFPDDIEGCLIEIDGIKECAAFPVKDDVLGEVVGVAVVTDGNVLKRQIMRYTSKHLADFQQPRKIYFLNELPKNSMNKLQRFKLKKLTEEGVE